MMPFVKVLCQWPAKYYKNLVDLSWELGMGAHIKLEREKDGL